MSDFPIHKAFLIGAWLASALWGIFTLLVLYALVTGADGNKGRPSFQKVLIFVSLLVLYALATCHVSLSLHGIIEAFIDPPPDTSPQLYAADPVFHRNKDMVYVTTLWISDSVIVWRCYMLWRDRSILVGSFPILLVLGTMICAYVSVAQSFVVNGDIIASANWATALYAISMATNVGATLLTAGRIWWMTRTFTNSTTSFVSRKVRYDFIAMLIIESGAVVALAKTIELILFVIAPDDSSIGNNSLYIMVDAMPQILGIAAASIILVVNANKTVQTYSFPGSKMTPPTPGSRSSATQMQFYVPADLGATRTGNESTGDEIAMEISKTGKTGET